MNWELNITIKNRHPNEKNQEYQAQKTTSSLYRNFLTGIDPLPIVIMDDETYISENDVHIFGKSRCYFKD